LSTTHAIIYGAGGHGRVIADIVEKSGGRVRGFVDDNESLHGKPFYGYSLLGGMDRLITFLEKSPEDFQVIIAVGDNHVRCKIAAKLKNLQINFGTAIHPSAQIGKDATIGTGTVIMAAAVVNPGSVIGDHCIVNTAVTVDHECQLDDYVHLSPGSHLGGTVRVGRLSWIGLGAAVINNIDIGENVTVGAGSVVIRNIEENCVMVGNPAILLKKNYPAEPEPPTEEIQPER